MRSLLVRVTGQTLIHPAGSIQGQQRRPPPLQAATLGEKQDSKAEVARELSLAEVVCGNSTESRERGRHIFQPVKSM